MACRLYMEVDGIQHFVLASPKLKIIRGGSPLLDRFNRVEMNVAPAAPISDDLKSALKEALR